jgi:hypothetical protein
MVRVLVEAEFCLQTIYFGGLSETVIGRYQLMRRRPSRRNLETFILFNNYLLNVFQETKIPLSDDFVSKPAVTQFI